MARSLRIVHRTEYTYDRLVHFNAHSLMLRPRDGHDMWVEDALLAISPPATLRWYFDTFGNSIAEAIFQTPGKRLLIESTLLIRTYLSDHLLKPTRPLACAYPFAYSQDDALDLRPFLGLQCPEDAQALRHWLEASFHDRPDNAFGFLCSLSDAIHRAVRYSAREEMGTQSPVETIEKGVGTCRDFAFLFMEAARGFGFAARFATGYLNDLPADGSAAIGGGSTHAWAEIFLPGEGWIEFDPTNRIVGGGALIRVATTRKPSQASPVSGSFLGKGAVCLGPTVSVTVEDAVKGETA
jgi:transglutaminase-like putative cysteine protease